MSISLVVLRLEIADKSEQPKEFNFEGLRLVEEHISPTPRQSYAAVVSKLIHSESQTDSTNHEDFFGQRKFRDISIETYIEPAKNTDLIMDGMTTGAGVICNDVTEKVTNKELNSVKMGQAASSSRSNSESTDSRVSSRQSSEGRSSREGSYRSVGSRGSPASLDDPPSRSSTISNRSSSHSSGLLHFYSGNPSVELTKGILHIYKDSKKIPIKDDVSRSEMICMLSVPAAYTIHDLLTFTSSVNPNVEFMRIIRNSTPNQYMVLIKFRDQSLADEFFGMYNNKPYNSIEPDICHLVYVAKVESVKESEGGSLPVPGLTELPNCPVCLERMEESVDGVLTILCNHAFHMTCLAQWGDTSCPVCRYCQTPEEVPNNKCMKCGSQESLWICLICGHIGCGRYVGMHAHRHFQDTQHTYSMQLGSNQVWDYAGDNFVHRLIQNKSDGKLVEVDERGNLVEEEKLDSLTLEYTYLLTSQLESQRLYFEEKMTQVEQESAQHIDEIESRLKKASEHSEKISADLSTSMKEKNMMEKKCSHLHTRLTKALTEFQEEKEMNKCLLENQQLWQKRVAVLESHVKELTETKETEIQDLKDQLRDVMFYLEAQQKLAGTTEVTQEEIQDGQVVIGATGRSVSPGKKSRKKTR